MSEYAKDTSYKRIKAIMETYVGNPQKRIFLNHIEGQVKSALVNKILTNEDILRMNQEIEKRLEKNILYPFGPLSIGEKLERFQQIKDVITKRLTVS